MILLSTLEIVQMDRKQLLMKLLDHLAEAVYLMEITEVEPDDNDHIWNFINDAHFAAEQELNHILMQEQQGS